MEQPTRFIGMDVHKETIVVAVTAAGEVGKATSYGTHPNTPGSLEKRLRGGGSGALKFCYEAGPCGYGVHHTLTRLGEDCLVAAPSMIPRKSGDRQKNDKRAGSLAVLHRGGLLTAVWVPDVAHAAMRDPRVKPKDKLNSRAAGGGACGASSPSATEWVPPASRADLSRRWASLDKGASRLAG